MSQAGIINTSSGPVPPTVPTQFTTDAGIAIPVANNLNVFGNDTIANNTDGLTTTGVGDTVTVFLTNRISVSATTIGATSQTVTLMTPTASTALEFTVSIIGYDVTGNAAAGGELVGIATTSGGGTVLIIGTNDTFDEASPTLVATDWDIVTNGTAIQVSFTGVAGITIVWRALYEYIQSP